MWYALLWRVLGWFTWTHIQWIAVQALGTKGLEFALDRLILNIIHSDGKKPVDKMTVADIRSHLKGTP